MKLLDDQAVIWINYWPYLVNIGWPKINTLEQKLDWEEAKPLIAQQSIRTTEWVLKVLEKDGFNKVDAFLKTCHPLLTKEENKVISDLLCLG